MIACDYVQNVKWLQKSLPYISTWLHTYIYVKVFVYMLLSWSRTNRQLHKSFCLKLRKSQPTEIQILSASLVVLQQSGNPRLVYVRCQPAWPAFGLSLMKLIPTSPFLYACTSVCSTPKPLANLFTTSFASWQLAVGGWQRWEVDEREQHEK